MKRPYGFLDIADAENVQVEVRDDGKVLWVNIDGECVLRLSKIGLLEMPPEKLNPRQAIRNTLASIATLALGYLLCSFCGCAAMRPSVSEPVGPTAQAQGAAVAAEKLTGIEAKLEALTTIQMEKGIEIDQALPWGFMPMMMFHTWLSHRREAMRIKQRNGKHHEGVTA